MPKGTTAPTLKNNTGASAWQGLSSTFSSKRPHRTSGENCPTAPGLPLSPAGTSACTHHHHSSPVHTYHHHSPSPRWSGTAGHRQSGWVSFARRQIRHSETQSLKIKATHNPPRHRQGQTNPVKSLLMLPPPSSAGYPHLPYEHQVMLTAKGALQLQHIAHPAATNHSVPQALKEPETSICRENPNHAARGSEEQHHRE